MTTKKKPAQSSRSVRAERPVEEQSQLPFFEVRLLDINEEEGSYTVLHVTCPSCRNWFHVPLAWRIRREVKGRDDDPPARIIGAPCPHCSRTARKPSIKRKFRRSA